MDDQDARRASEVLTSLHFGRKTSIKRLSKAKGRDRRVTLHWGWRSHIRGIGAGYKRVSGEVDRNVPCLTIYVRRKFPRGRLPEPERIPDRLFLATLGTQVQTDIIEVRNPIVAHAATNIQPGQDVAHQFGELGTLGLLARGTASGNVFALGCSHVLARSGVQANPGDFVEHPPLFARTQLDQNEFGKLTRTFTELNSTDTFEEDFALAVVDVPFKIALAGSGVVVDSIADAGQGFEVGLGTSIQGFRTNGAPGKVINPQWSGQVQEVPFVGTVNFSNLVPYSTMCAPGDSGAAVLQLGTSTVLGLHVAGSSDDQFGLFMPLFQIFKSLDLNLLAEQTP